MKLSYIMLLPVALYLVSTCICSTEPVCSKFPYDEALLEKMIRTEFKMEKLQDTFQEISDDVKDELSTYKDSFDNLSNIVNETLSTAKTMQENFVGKVEAKLSGKSELLEVKMNLVRKEINETLQQELGDMKQEVAALTELVGKLQLTGGGINPTIAFKAHQVSNTGPSAGETLVFEKELLDEGGAYSTETGVFTAPYSGLYFFTAQMGVNSASRIACSIMVEDKEIGRVYSRGPKNSVASTSSDAVAMVTKGDRVYVKTIVMERFLNQSTLNMISFSGFLLRMSE